MSPGPTPSRTDHEPAATRRVDTFALAPVALWIEDFSATKAAMDDLRRQGVTDLGAWFSEDESRAAELASTLVIRACNPAAASMLGARSPEALMERLAEVFLPETHELVQAKLVALWRGEPVFRREAPLRHLEGHRVETLFNLHLPPDPNDPMDHVLVSTADITERVRASERREESERRLDLAIWGADLGLWDWNVETNQALFNAQWGSMLGYEAGEIEGTGDSWKNRIHPDDLDEVMPILEAHLSGETQDYRVVHRLRRKDGGWHWVLSAGRVYERAEDGSPLRAAGVHVDINASKLKELELARQENLFQSILQSASVGIVLVGPMGQVEMTNPSMCRMLGMTKTQLLSASVLEITHPDDLDRSREILGNVSTMATGFTFEKRLIRRQGEVIWVRIHVTRLPKIGQQEHRLLGVVEDISDEVRRMAQRRGFEQKVQQTQKLESLGVLAGGIAHDFNNLLVGILGNAGLAAAKLDPKSEVLDNLTRIEEAANRASELTAQMLAYSGGGTFVVGRVELSALINDMVPLLQVAVGRLATLELDLGRDVPAVQGDAQQIQQVAMNLVSNAAEAIDTTTNGTIRVRTGAQLADKAFLAMSYAATDLPPGRYGYVEVEDDGVGMSPEIIQRAFDPFFTTKPRGRGLGMAATLGIVRGHDGAIIVDSQPRRGTRVRVLFPLAGPETKAPAHIEEEEAPPKRAPCVLVVDDEPSVLMVAREVLETGGFVVREAADGLAGLRAYEEYGNEIDVVLLDLTMPALPGLRVLERIRAIDPTAVVVLSSGHSAEAAKIEGIAGETPSFLKKPYPPRVLLEAIREALPARK